MARAGRPTKLTPEVQAKITQAISGGNFRTVAAEWAGISQKVFFEWMARGKRERAGIYHAFREAVIEAERAAEIRMVALVMKAATEDPRHAEWWLERKRPERWGRKDRHEVKHTGTTTVHIIEETIGGDPSGEGTTASGPAGIPPE